MEEEVSAGERRHSVLAILKSRLPTKSLYYFLEQNVVSLKDKSKSRKTKTESKQKNDKKTEASNGWILFSDFYEITHIVTKETGVTIYRQDNKTMVNEPVIVDFFVYA